MLGILGGTFDPVHTGHLRFAEEARRRLGLDAVALVPVGVPVHRSPARATAGQRRAMLAAAVRGRRGLYVDGRELAGEGPRWTIDTLASFRAESAGRSSACCSAPISYGCSTPGGAGVSLPTTPIWWWRGEPALDGRRRGPVSRWAEARRCDDPDELRTRPAGGVLMLDLPAADVSSTAVRARCAAGERLTGLVPEAVRDYIQRESLYSDGA